jgi:excinuclease ABC subunit A
LCNGLGQVTEVAIDKIVPDRRKSLKKGAIAPLGPYKGTWVFRQMEAVLAALRPHADTPVREMEDEVLARASSTAWTSRSA